MEEMMNAFGIRPVTEADLRAVVEACGGEVAHPDADRRTKRGGDFIFEGAAIELKLLDEDGFQKAERQAKLAELFREEGFTAPVVVLDRETLSADGQRTYDRIIEGPIKTAVASARQQLRQTRKERLDATHSILWLINNGYTALNHDEITALAARRVRNDTSNIDGIIVAGGYFHSDGFDSFFLWPVDYVPIRLRNFPAFDALRSGWSNFAEGLMSKVVRGEVEAEVFKGPVVDTEFTYEGITYVKPAPPIGHSDFFVHGRPRKNSTGMIQCPPVARTFPGLSQAEWKKFRQRWASDIDLRESYSAWLRYEHEAGASGYAARPFVRITITFEGWKQWCEGDPSRAAAGSIYLYANDAFESEVRSVLASAREKKEGALLPSRFILLITEEIGMDKANDLSHIARVQQYAFAESEVQPLVEDLRAFHEHALPLASAYAVRDGVEAVMWVRNQRYAWS